MRYRQLILLGSIAVCLAKAPVSFSDGTTTSLSSLGATTNPTLQLDTPLATSITTAAESDQVVDEERLAHHRKLFLRAEQHIQRRNESRYLSLKNDLGDYPLIPVLEYQWLRRNLGDKDGIRTFLTEYGHTRYAWPLRKRWLNRLARQGQWQDFVEAWKPNSDTALNCHYQFARYQTGEKRQALLAAQELWKAGRSQPSACDKLFTRLLESDTFTEELAWQRFDAALTNGKTRLARYISKQLSTESRDISDIWIKAHRQPETVINQLIDAEPMLHDGKIFAHAIRRLASDDIAEAIELWDQHKDRFIIDDKLSVSIDRRLAMKLAGTGDPAAIERLASLSLPDQITRETRVRVAIRLQDWPAVIDAIEQLDESAQQSERWQYWLARAWNETGKPVQAEETLDALADKRDYYGYLAAEQLGTETRLGDDPLSVSDAMIRDVSQQEGFRMAFELMALGRERDAKLQWWHALKSLQHHEIAAAAKLAQRWLWDEVAIFTIARIKQWDDIALRFPVRYSDQIHTEAERHDIDPAVIFGLIRRESAFNDDAHSHAGARGLMQLMPGTARQVAKELNYRWRGNSKLFEADRNIRFGSYYLSKLLQRFNGNHAMALAAYNAGPHRVKRWLPDETMPADVWIETIPFRETREYVSHVMVYSMIYQQLLGNDDLTMAGMASDIEAPVDLAQND